MSPCTRDASLQDLVSLGGWGSLPGATVSLSRKRPSRPWMRTSPPPALLTMSLACRMASAWVWGVLGVSGLHIPTAVRVADDIAVVGRRHDGSSSARDSLESEIRMRRREVRPHFDGMLRACKIGVRPQRRVLRLNRWDRFERVTLIGLLKRLRMIPSTSSLPLRRTGVSGRMAFPTTSRSLMSGDRRAAMTRGRPRSIGTQERVECWGSSRTRTGISITWSSSSRRRAARCGQPRAFG